MKEDNRPRVYKVIGAPGTGKTTRVVGNPELEDHTSLVQDNLDEYGMENQAIVTYTKAGVEEAQERLYEMHDYPKNLVKDRVLTIHAHCYRALNVDQDQVVRWWHKQNFCSMVDLTYGNESDEGDIMSSDSDEGHTFFDIYGWLKNNMVGVENWQECPAEWDSGKNFEDLYHRWEEFKEDNNLIQFSDMIEMAVNNGQEMLHNSGYPNIFGENPDDPMETFKQTRELDRFEQEEWRGRSPFMDTEVLYVDEVQDLYPLQWAWYLMQKLIAEKVYIGGDDDQTIYGWAGADPSFMLDEEGDFEVLDKTYRIPQEIWEVCDGVIQQVDKRQDKDVTPHGDGGEFVPMRNPRAKRVVEHLKEDECMVLFRANYMVDDFREDLHELGIPYDNMSTFETWSDEVTLVRDGLAKLKDGEDKLKSEEVQALIDNAVRDCSTCNGEGCHKCDGEGEESMLRDKNGWDNTEMSMSTLSGVKVERLQDIFDVSMPYNSGRLTPKTYLRQTVGLNYYEVEAIKGNLQNNNEHMDPDRVRIGTIHSSKGKEAETVVLSLDSTQQILTGMREDTEDQPDKKISDAERRVYYVGMTRASEELVLCEGLLDQETSIRIDDLLEGEDSEGEEEQWAKADTQTGLDSKSW